MILDTSATLNFDLLIPDFEIILLNPYIHLRLVFRPFKRRGVPSQLSLV